MKHVTQRTRALTIIEVLIAISILAVVMLAFTQIFGSTLSASSEINSRNELLSEGQIAQQIIVSRLQEAYLIYPGGTSFTLTNSGVTTRKPTGGQTWQINNDPIVAMILPPTVNGDCSVTDNACFSFYAYYPVNRGNYINSALANSNKPDPDPLNDDLWMLMEYRANIRDGVDRSSNLLLNPPTPAAALAAIRGQQGRILVDYVQPTNAAPNYTLFNTNSTEGWVDFDLRLLKHTGKKDLTAPSANDPLSVRVYPRNITSAAP